MRRPRFLDYYRQFEAISPEEDSRRLRERRDAQRSRELELTPLLDLSRGDWHEPPDPEIVNAATFALRRALNRYADRDGTAARAAVARHHDIPEEQVAIGHGAAQLMQAAVRQLALGGEVVMPWPSWGPLPGLVSRAGARPVPIPAGSDGSVDVGALAEAAQGARAVVICSPNDPTGVPVAREELRELAAALPDRVAILVDEALVDWAGEDASALALVSDLPALLVFRSFSKGWALAGLRIGYAVGSPAAAPLLAGLSPGLGVASPALAAVVAALDPDGKPLRRLALRRERLRAERERLSGELSRAGFSCLPSQTHHLWVGDGRGEGRALVAELADQRILVAPGTDWGDEEHVRITVRDRAASDRLTSVLRALAAGR